MLAGIRPLYVPMPPRKAVTAGKLRVQKAREKRAEEEAAVEPEVELEEPEEEPAAEESQYRQLLEAHGAQRRRDLLFYAFHLWIEGATLLKIDRRHAESVAWVEADTKAREEKEEKDRLKLEEALLKIDEVERLRVQQRVAACANGCVCVCAYGGSRKRDFSAMGPPLASRSVSTFNANV